MKTILTYAVVIVGALLAFTGFIWGAAALYAYVSPSAALAWIVGLVGLAGAWLMVEEGPEEDEPVEAYSAPEGGNVVDLREAR